MAPQNRKKLPLKRALEPRRHQGSEDDSTTVVQGRMRQSNELRSKQRNDAWHVDRRQESKGKSIARSPPVKKRRTRVQSKELHGEDLSPMEDSLDVSGHRSMSDYSDNTAEVEEDDTIIVEKQASPPPRKKRQLVKKERKEENKRKQYVEVDKRGHPHRKITSFLIEDVKLFAKGLNPLYGWANQPLHEKQRFYERLYTDWEVGGDQTEINPQWFPYYVTKTLINVRHTLMKLIDAEKPKPPEVDDILRETLQERRNSEQMRSISKAKGCKEAQMRAIEKTMIGELVQEATEQEYGRRQALARNPTPKYGVEIEEVRVEMGGRLSHLEDQIQWLINSLGNNSLQQLQLRSGLGGPSHVGGIIGNDVLPSATLEEQVAPGVRDDGGMNTSVIADVVEDAAADSEDVPDYLKDNLSDIYPNPSANSNDAEDIQGDTEKEDPKSASIPAIEVVDKDVNKDVIKDGEDKDPYSITSKDVVGLQAPMLIPPAMPTKAQEVANLPSSGTSSRSNRVTRGLPSAKANKFAPPSKATKGPPAKVVKASPAQVVEQPQKGDSQRKK